MFTIKDNTRPEKTVPIQDIPPGRFLKFIGPDTRLYRKVAFDAHDDAKKLFNHALLVELVETGSLVLARANASAYEVEVEVTILRVAD